MPGARTWSVLRSKWLTYWRETLRPPAVECRRPDRPSDRCGWIFFDSGERPWEAKESRRRVERRISRKFWMYQTDAFNIIVRSELLQRCAMCRHHQSAKLIYVANPNRRYELWNKVTFLRNTKSLIAGPNKLRITIYLKLLPPCLNSGNPCEIHGHSWQ